MAVATMKVPTIFYAVDRFSDVVSKMTRKTVAFGETAQAAAMRSSRAFNSAGTNMLSAGVGMALGLGYAVNESIKYEKAIASLAAVTGTSVGEMNQQIESLGKETKRSVIDIAKSFEIVGSKMSQYLDKPDELKSITKASILMADASKMELEPAIESLTGVMNIFGKSAADANYIVNKLSAGEIVGSISIAETADVLRQFGGTARLANVQVDESIALIQTLTKSLGIEGVGRGIRNLMTDLNMVGAFDKNKVRALTSAGVNMDILGDKSLDLVTRLRELKKLEGKSAAMGLFFKKTGIQTGATMFQNFDDYIRFLDAIKKTNAAQEQAAKNNATLAKRIKDLKAQVSLLAIKFGDALIPLINKFADRVFPIIEKTTEWIKNNKWLAITLMKATIWLLALGVAAKIGAVLFYGLSTAIGIVSGIMKAYTFVSTMAALANVGFATALWGCVTALWAFLWPIGLVVLAIGALIWIVIDMVQHWEDWRDVLLVMTGPLGQIWLLIEKIGKHWSHITGLFEGEGIMGAIKGVGIMLEDFVLGTLVKIFNIMGRIPLIGSPFKEMANDLKGIITQIPSEMSVEKHLRRSPNGITSFGDFNTTSWDAFKTPQNLAGKNGNDGADGVNGKGGVLKVVVESKDGSKVHLDESQLYGIPVMLGNNQGSWNKYK